MASKRLQSVLEVLARLDVVFMVSASFIRFGSACGDDANGAVSQRVGHVEDAAVDHAQDAVTVLAIVRAVIKALSGEWILENLLGRLETHAMVGIVLRGLGIVPFKLIIVHNTTD